MVVVAADGRVRKTLDVPVPASPDGARLRHHEKYFVLLDLPVLFAPEAIERGGSFPYLWKPENGARVGLLPREGGAADVIWREVEPCYVFHPLNAYDDADGRVVLDVMRHPQNVRDRSLGPNEGPPTSSAGSSTRRAVR